MSSTAVAVIALAAYLAVVLGLAVLDWHRGDAASFMIARRRVGSFATMASIVGNLRDGAGVAAWIVLGLYFGYGALWLTSGLCAGLILMGWLSPKLRELAEQRGYYSANQLVRDEIGPKSATATAVIVAVTAFLYAAAQTHVAGRILGALLHVPAWVGIAIAVSSVGIYLSIGGYATSIRTGVFQWFILMLVVFLPWLLQPSITLPDPSTFGSPGPASAFGFAAISFLVTFSSTDLWQLVFSARSGGEARRGFILSVPAYVFVSAGMVLLAAAVGAAVGASVRPEDAFFTLFQSPSIPAIALAFVGVFIAAAVMSTLDSQVFLISATIVGRARRHPANNTLARESRLVIIALLISLALVSTLIADLVEFLFGAVTLATVLVPLLSIAAAGRRSISDAGAVGSLLVAVVVYAAMFVSGAFANILLTIVPASVATVCTIAVLIVRPRRISETQ
jgi:Na+/proline symporter